MIQCPECGHENPDASKFCSQCGVALTHGAVERREERKVVTIVFVDLVGFTARSETLDPEDVRTFLSPYYRGVREELERYGGTVEKFIGDAVMAVFGAPTAHEDDPERAVRAALAVRDRVTEQQAQLQLRVGVNTGEALVSLGARPSEGEGMVSGDVVNTAARLQSVAPVNGILVGETTYRATSHVVEYGEIDPVTAKGKSAPVAAWEALDVRARFGADLRRHTGPLIGREEELRLVTDALARVRRDRSPQLLTIVGVPGIGKSRLVGELFAAVESDPSGFVRWRQGRSLPYGDGVTFWALSEMVKAQAGILESDSAAECEEKLAATVRDVVPDAVDAPWIAGQLRPLVGLEVTERGGDRQGEAFTAWRRFFEGLAEQQPLTLVFEDMQWADSSLLDFVEHLIDWSSGVPLLVVCTARPELFERRPGWAGGKRNATTISLTPLSDDETARLISSLSDRPVLALEAQQELIARSGGNPLYAEQFVRMRAERRESADMPMPETVQGIIGARLDALTGEEKVLLQDSAVIGKVFWLGAVADIGGIDRVSAERHLHALERKEFVQRARRSGVAGELEYSFLHVLVRDVAYGQIPRGVRATKHQVAAAWLERLGRAEDHAEMLAHHYQSAAELMRAAGQPMEPAFERRVLESMRDAGDRSFALNAFPKAAAFFAAALPLAPDGSRERAMILFRLAEAHRASDTLAPELMIEARDLLLGAGEREKAGEAAIYVAEAYWQAGDAASRTLEHLDVARQIVADLSLSRAKALIICSVSRFLMLASQPHEAIRIGREGLAMAEALADDELRAHATNNIGVSTVDLGDEAGGIALLEQAVHIAGRAGAGVEWCRALGNLASCLWERGYLGQATKTWDQAMEVATRYGQLRIVRWVRGQLTDRFYRLGEWDRALVACEEFIREVEAGSPHYLASSSYLTRSLVRLARDEVQIALADALHALEIGTLSQDPQAHLDCLAQSAFIFSETGDVTRASAILDEFLDFVSQHKTIGFAVTCVQTLAWTASRLGRSDELLRSLGHLSGRWVEAGMAFARGDLQSAVDIVGGMGAVSDEAYDRLRLGSLLLEQGHRAQGEAELQRALRFYRSVNALRYIRQGEALLAQSA
jgi:class 3 adenylate cyclase/tetratricopeptide (TPR) repeat protein